VVAFQVEAVIRGQLAIAIGHQGHLLGPGLANQRQQPRIVAPGRCKGISLDVELDPAAGQRRQVADVAGADMALVGPRMHGQAAGAGGHYRAGGCHDAGLAAAARVAQHGHFVHIDAQYGHGE